MTGATDDVRAHATNVLGALLRVVGLTALVDTFRPLDHQQYTLVYEASKRAKVKCTTKDDVPDKMPDPPKAEIVDVRAQSHEPFAPLIVASQPKLAFGVRPCATMADLRPITARRRPSRTQAPVGPGLGRYGTTLSCTSQNPSSSRHATLTRPPKRRLALFCRLPRKPALPAAAHLGAAGRAVPRRDVQRGRELGARFESARGCVTDGAQIGSLVRECKSADALAYVYARPGDTVQIIGNQVRNEFLRHTTALEPADGPLWTGSDSIFCASTCRWKTVHSSGRRDLHRDQRLRVRRTLRRDAARLTRAGFAGRSTCKSLWRRCSSCRRSCTTPAHERSCS